MKPKSMGSNPKKAPMTQADAIRLKQGKGVAGAQTQVTGETVKGKGRPGY